MLVEAGQDVVNVEKVRAHAAAANGKRGVHAVVNSSRGGVRSAPEHTKKKKKVREHMVHVRGEVTSQRSSRTVKTQKKYILPEENFVYMSF